MGSFLQFVVVLGGAGLAAAYLPGFDVESFTRHVALWRGPGGQLVGMVSILLGVLSLLAFAVARRRA